MEVGRGGRGRWRWMKVGGGGWRRVELGGGGWKWIGEVEVGGAG